MMLSDPLPSEPTPERVVPGPGSRWATGTAPRRPALTRLVLAAVLAVVAVGLLGLGGSRAVRFLIDRLHRLPEYQLPFREIVLDPPPPPWIQSGRLGLLERVRVQAHWPELLPVLNLDLEDLARDFRNHSAWVARVRRPRGIERSYPNRLVVRLDYREPVAEVRCGPSAFVLDGDAVILPADDLDRDAAGPLVRLHGLDPPFDGRPGQYWGSAADGLAEPDPRAAAASRLAAFLKAKTRREAPGRLPFRPIAIRHRDPDGSLCVLGEASTWVCWGEAPGAEVPGRPTAAEKWEMLRAWARLHGPADVVDPDFLDFTRDGVVVRTGKARTP